MGYDPFSANKGNEDSNEFQFDFDPSDVGLLPEGLYEARVIHIEQSVSRTSGNPMIVWDFVVHEGEYAGKEIRLWTSLAQNALWKLQETLAGLGLMINGGKPGENGQMSSKPFTPESVRGTLCQIKVSHSEYNGRQSASVDAVMPSRQGVGAKWEGNSNPFAPPQQTEEVEESTEED